MKRNKGKFAPYKHFPWLGAIYLASLLIMIVAGTTASDSTYLSPLVVEEAHAQITEVKVTVKDKNKFIKVKVSHYWPELGGTNCGNFVNGECVSRMANGERWQDHVGVAIACPKELKFGTKIKIDGRVWECKDRGSRITKYGDEFWVDMLTPYSLMPYGSVTGGEIL